MHRFVWNLAWGSSGGPNVDEESEYRNPSGPKIVPGIYSVRLTVDGQPQTQLLKVVMDPRSSATPEILQQQLELGQQVFADTLEARHVLAEISSVQKQLAEAERKLGDQNPDLKSALANAQSEISKLVTHKEIIQEQPAELKRAITTWSLLWRVVEGGDRTVPSQAIALYQVSSHRIKESIVEWIKFKTNDIARAKSTIARSRSGPDSRSRKLKQQVQLQCHTMSSPVFLIGKKTNGRHRRHNPNDNLYRTYDRYTGLSATSISRLFSIQTRGPTG